MSTIKIRRGNNASLPAGGTVAGEPRFSLDTGQLYIDNGTTNVEITPNTTNVTAAGALMDSEVDADLKTLSLPANTTISAYGATLVDDADAGTARSTLGLVIGTNVQAYDANNATASSTTTFTNKTIDANGTGNSISNLEVADFTAAAIVTEADAVSSNDNDTTLPTSAAVKDYVDGIVRTGWTPAEETWTYSSVDDPTGIISVASDATTRFSAGMRIKFTNGGNTIYGIITAVAATTITFLHQIDPSDNLALVLMANSAITAPYFSVHKAPLGFPLDPLKWSVRTSDSTGRNQNTPTANTWYNLNGFSLSIPIGSWRIGYECSFYSTKDSNSFTDGWITLSTANNTQSDTDFTVYINVGGATGNQQIRVGVIREFVRTITSKQTRYLNIGSPNTGVTSIGLQNVQDPATIYAECAYL